jgi:Ca-activated chloride channel family protein
MGMIEFMGGALLRPWWLLALPLIVILGFLIMKPVSMLAEWHRAIDSALLETLEKLGRVIPGRKWRNQLPLPIALIIAVALVGPARQTNSTDNFRNLDGFVIVMDLSRSVTEGGHFAEARTAARYIAQRADGRPIGLVIYAGDAYLASSFTTDAAVLGTTIAILDGDTIPDSGSRPERGLAVARKLLRNANIISGDVILVTDGGGLSDAAIQETENITSIGGRVSTLFVPENEQLSVQSIALRSDRTALDTIARMSGGIAGDVLSPISIADNVASRNVEQLASSELAALIWYDYGRYLLLLALIPALGLFRRGG